MNRNTLQVFFDLGFILLSFALAFHIVDVKNGVNLFGPEFLKRIAFVCTTQLLVFLAFGQYKRTYQFFGIGDALAIVRTLLLAVLVVGVVEAIFLPPFQKADILVLALDNFFLTSMVIGLRLSYRVLQYLAKNDPPAKRRVLIYGADVNGSLFLERMVESNILDWTPVGFIDENPAMQGKFLNGYRVFGSHWNLHKLIRDKKINEIVICSETIQTEVLRRVRKLAKEYGVVIKQLRVLYEDYHEEKELKPVLSKESEFHPAPEKVLQLRNESMLA
jgi:FlaA1/EpsC-like NDP-sugar epimerase